MRGGVGERDWAGRGEEESEELKQYNLQGQKVSWEGKILFLFSFFSLFLRRERGDRERQRHRDKHRATEMHKQAHAQKQ